MPQNFPRFEAAKEVFIGKRYGNSMGIWGSVIGTLDFRSHESGQEVVHLTAFMGSFAQAKLRVGGDAVVPSCFCNGRENSTLLSSVLVL